MTRRNRRRGNAPRETLLGSDREVFRFMTLAWDVTTAKGLIALRKSGPRCWVEVKQVIGIIGLVKIDHDYAMSDAVDLDEPIIVAPMPRSLNIPTGIVIDGWHRLHHAHAEGRERMSAYVLTHEVEVECRLSR